MKTLGISSLRKGYEFVRDALAREGELVLTRNGKPVARIVPISAGRLPMPSLREFRASQTVQTKPIAVTIRRDRDER